MVYAHNKAHGSYTQAGARFICGNSSNTQASTTIAPSLQGTQFAGSDYLQHFNFIPTPNAPEAPNTQKSSNFMDPSQDFNQDSSYGLFPSVPRKKPTNKRQTMWPLRSIWKP
ncbi:hypothetical protein JCGZ_11009 [Jatropha curcas]|uniref:Uncharacterized protein n=1 Tax=Jatropha curcas TaxID=180498 RepID=A0A067KEK6_JATCU|nr:hypothetical protein JCGZ_11009 [Jatropha curcas]